MGEWKALKKASGAGWKELEHEAGTGWKALLWETVPIDVGSPCIIRNEYGGAGYTYVNYHNPANANGTLTNVCLYMFATASTYIGIFYVVSGNTLKCRSAHNAGSLDTGTNNVTVSMAIQTGDYIGVYSASAHVYISTDTGGYGIWYYNGNTCVVDNQTVYTWYDAGQRALSAYGTG